MEDNIVKMSILLNAIYRFNAIHIKIPKAFFTEMGEKKFLKFTWNHIHKNVNGQSNLEKEKSWTHALILDFRIHYKAIVIQTAEYWQKNRHADQRDSTEPRNKTMHLWSKGFHQRFQRHTTGKGVPSVNGLVYPSVEEGS